MTDTANTRASRVELMGVGFDCITEGECVQDVFDRMERGTGGWVVTPNLDHVRRVSRSPSQRALYDEASLSVADGMPLIWASRLQGTPLPERVAGSNLIWSLSSEAGKRGKRVYFFGGDPGTADQAASILSERFPGLVVAGTDCPDHGFERRPETLAAAVSRMKAAAPDLILVALGSPKQEDFIAGVQGELPDAWWIGIGISFSFVSGDVRRAPLWMQRLGIEWLHRLVQEPRRLARRYLVDDLPFAFRLFVDSAKKRLSRSSS